ncbi:MAG: hypothetical protein SFV18_00475 [Bryobacteraceae bacterium]|nr:hypothetical protein [Bryobacteraceae bacterium]
MSASILGQLRQAAGKLNPNEVRSSADRPVHVHLRARSEAAYESMIRFLVPDSLSDIKKRAVAVNIHLEGEEGGPGQYDLRLVERGLRVAPDEFVWDGGDERTLVKDVLDRKETLGLPLARRFPAFREEVSRRTIQSISVENTMFSVVTSLPNIAPYVGLVWTPAEFASDTAFLTLNQIRMIFLLGAASDREIGYGEQKSEIASLVAGAFGWRAVARELAAKIPAGGGIVPKAAIAFAGTWVVGASIERLYRAGHSYTRGERKAAYGEAFERGKQVATAIFDRWRNR